MFTVDGELVANIWEYVEKLWLLAFSRCQNLVGSTKWMGPKSGWDHGPCGSRCLWLPAIVLWCHWQPAHTASRS